MSRTRDDGEHALTKAPPRSAAPGDARGSLAERISELGVVDVRTKRELGDLVTHLLSDRGQPVVALAAIEGAELAVLPPRSVRAIIGPDPPIYAILQEGLLRRLTDALGSALTLTAGAARIWWPGLASGSDPRDHPLVSPIEVVRAGGLLEEFARRFDLSRPRVREEIRRLDEARAAVEGQLQRTRDQLANTERHVRVEQVERHREQTRAESAEAELCTFERRLEASRVEHLLHALIFREWMSVLTDDERREYPLGPYVLSAEMLEQVLGRRDMPRERVAWMCAMIVSRYPPGLTSISRHPVLAGAGGPQVERSSDGAQGWRCTLEGDVRGGPRLQYWERPDRTIEFTAVGGHDEPGRGER